MATSSAALPQQHADFKPEEKRVIFASSLGTVFEWYDFYLYATLAPFFAARPHGNGGMFALQRLDPGHFVSREHPLAGRQQGWGLRIEGGQVRHLLLGQGIRLGIEPVAAFVGLDLGLILKNDRHGARRWSRQSHVGAPHRLARVASND